MKTTEEIIVPELRILRLEETEHWSEDMKERCGRIWSVWVFDLNRHVHICSFDRYHECHYVGHTWSKPQDTEEQSQDLFEDMLEATREENLVDYFLVGQVKPDECKVISSPTEEEWVTLLGDHDGDREAALEGLIEDAVEYCSANGYAW